MSSSMREMFECVVTNIDEEELNRKVSEVRTCTDGPCQDKADGCLSILVCDLQSLPENSVDPQKKSIANSRHRAQGPFLRI